MDQALEIPKTVAALQTQARVFSSRWIDCIDELELMQTAWDRLARNAIWPNAANESNYLIPAIRHLGYGQVRVLVVESNDQLCGLFPLKKSKIYRFPLLSMELWKHDQCFDATPLVRNDCAPEVLEFALRRLADENVALLGLDTVAGEPEFTEAISTAVHRLKLSCFQRDHYHRAAFRPAASVEAYLASCVSKSVRKTCKRLARRLSEQGLVKTQLADNKSDLDRMVDAFLRIEQTGWKGDSGTALACSADTENFYREMIERSAAGNKARFLTLSVDQKPIAILSDLVSNGRLYSFKTAFDESWSKFSPGQQLELQNIEFMHNQNLQFADSCSTPDNTSIGRIWGQRVTFQNLVLGLRPGVAQWATRLMPWMQAASKQIKEFHTKN